MTDFDGDAFDDGGLHTMSMVANGDSVQLILDGQVGAEVRFPFQKVKFQFGAFARADNDTAETTWDNLSISTALATSVVFSDDFSSGEIDPAKFRPDSPFFEGGEGDIQAQAGDGVMKFVGTTTQQWWSGGTLELVPTFNATEDTPVTLNIDQVSEAGVGQPLEVPCGYSMRRSRIISCLRMCAARGGVIIERLERMGRSNRGER